MISATAVWQYVMRADVLTTVIPVILGSLFATYLRARRGTIRPTDWFAHIIGGMLMGFAAGSLMAHYLPGKGQAFAFLCAALSGALLVERIANGELDLSGSMIKLLKSLTLRGK